MASSTSSSSFSSASNTRELGKRAWRKIAKMAREHHESVTAASEIYYGVATGYAPPRRNRA
jgi:histidine ammonia-lyase